jgi:SAM-dependent methyltransferase
MDGGDLNSKQRFSSRVADYVKYRPDYPRAIVGMLRETIRLSPSWAVADVGCGTGISCRMFLENGNEVYGVEPNDDMLQAARAEFAGMSKFRAIKGAAEESNLPDGLVDLVVAAQAFHWFDRPACAREWKRILRPSPGGYVAIMWNTRLTTRDEFGREYDEVLHRHGTDYKEVAHRTPMSVDEFATVFGAPFQRLTAPNQQVFTWDELCGRVRSSSYTPLPGQPGHDELFTALRKLFDRRQNDGRVRFDYETELFCGKVR